MEKIKITNSNNHEFDVNLVMSFEVPEIDGKYIVYSIPSQEENMSILSVGKLVKLEDDSYLIDELVDDREWTFIKKIMFQIIGDGK